MECLHRRREVCTVVPVEILYMESLNVTYSIDDVLPYPFALTQLKVNQAILKEKKRQEEAKKAGGAPTGGGGGH
jgi:hypothetical protein